MRILVRLVVILVVFWCLWWALASWGVQRQIKALIEVREAEGWQIDASTSQRGFPFNIRTTLRALSASHPVQQVTLKASGGHIQARTIWPGFVDVALPVAPLVMQTPVGDISLTLQDGGGQLRLRPGPALELRRVTLQSGPWSLDADETAFLQAQGLSLTTRQAGAAPARYAFSLQVPGLHPGAVARQILGLPDDWPEVFEAFSAAGAVTFAEPLDRKALGDAPPRLRQITLDGLALRWGDVDVRASGALEVSADGTPVGRITAEIKEWKTLLDMAGRTGAIRPLVLMQTTLLMGSMARLDGNLNDITLEIDYADGKVFLNGEPFGLAPNFNAN